MEHFSQLAGSPAALMMLAAGLQVATLLLGWLIADALARRDGRALNVMTTQIPRRHSGGVRGTRDTPAARPVKIRALVVPLQRTERLAASAMIVRDAA